VRQIAEEPEVFIDTPKNAEYCHVACCWISERAVILAYSRNFGVSSQPHFELRKVRAVAIGRLAMNFFAIPL